MLTSIAGFGVPFRAFFSRVIAAVFPHLCAGCGEEGVLACDPCITEKLDPMVGFFVCPGCDARVDAFGRCGESVCRGSSLDGVASAGAYGDPFFRTLVRAWKYERVPEGGELVEDAFWKYAVGMRESLGEIGETPCVMAVPMHPFRVALRGFDQGKALAEAFAHGAGLSFSETVLTMRWRLRTQVGIGDPEARRRNAMRSVQAAGVPPSTVVLVDDVLTTGATLSACAVALKSAGAKRVYAVTFLHG